MIYRLITVILLVSALTKTGDAQWRKIHDFIGTDGSSFTGSEPITRVYFLDLPGPPRIGYVGTQSEVYKTTDGGVTWTSVWGNGKSYTNYYVVDICFKDTLTGWFTLFGGSKTLYRTIDGGQTWQPLPLVTNTNSIYYSASTGRLFLSQFDTVFLSSTDLGNTWKPVFPVLKGYYSGSIVFSTALNGLVGLSNDTTEISLITSDGGVSWDTTRNPENVGGASCAIPGTSTYFLSTYGQLVIYRSDDFGRTWEKTFDIGHWWSPAPTGFMGGDLSRLYVQTIDSGMYVSSDGGSSWHPDGGPSYVSQFTNDHFYSAKGVTIAGMTYSDGFVNSGGLWEEDWPYSSVESSADQPSFTSDKIEIFDLLGRCVYRGPKEKMPVLSPGAYIEREGSVIQKILR